MTLRSSGDIGGLAVHIGARVMSKADMRQVFVSEATAERARDAGLTFADRGVHQLKGVSGEHRILEIVGSQPLTSGCRRKRLRLVLTRSTPFAYPQVISRCFASSISAFHQVKCISVPVSIPGSSTSGRSRLGPSPGLFSFPNNTSGELPGHLQLVHAIRLQ